MAWNCLSGRDLKEEKISEDLVSRISRETAEISVKFSKQLFKELVPYVGNGKLSSLESYIPGFVKDCPTDSYEYAAMCAVLESGLEREVLVSVKGYINWVSCRIVRSGDYSVPSPAEIDFKAIREKYDVQPETLRRTASWLHSQKCLPLLGTIKKGRFNPDHEEFEKWKQAYDRSQPAISKKT